MCCGLWSSTASVQKSAGGRPCCNEPPGARFRTSPGTTASPAATIPRAVINQETPVRRPNTAQASQLPAITMASWSPSEG